MILVFRLTEETYVPQHSLSAAQKEPRSALCPYSLEFTSPVLTIDRPVPVLPPILRTNSIPEHLPAPAICERPQPLLFLLEGAATPPTDFPRRHHAPGPLPRTTPATRLPFRGVFIPYILLFCIRNQRLLTVSSRLLSKMVAIKDITARQILGEPSLHTVMNAYETMNTAVNT